MNWQQDLLTALDEVLKLPDGGDAGGWKCLGKVVRTDEPGWYALDLRSGAKSKFGSADNLAQLCLADAAGPDEGIHIPIERSLLADGVLKVKVAGPLPNGADLAWTVRLSPRHLLKRLRDGIAGVDVDRVPIAGKLAARTLDPVPSGPFEHPAGLVPGQAAAYRACLTPGLHAVWGPPGTGKTTVLSHAVRTLVEDGMRVLIVSTANIAVDNALAQVVDRLRPSPGQVIRVGPPHLPALAADDDVQLHRLAARATARTDAELAEVQAELARLDDVDEQLAELDVRLAEHDHDAYGSAVRRIAATRQWQDRRQELATAYERSAQAGADRDAARAAVRLAEADVAHVEPGRRALADVDVHLRELLRVEHELALRRAVVDQERAAVPVQGRLRIWRATMRLHRVVAAHATYEHATLDVLTRLRSLVAMRSADAGHVTAELLGRLDAALAAALVRLAEAESVDTATSRRVSELETEVAALQAGGLATDGDRELVERADQAGWPAAHGRRTALRAVRRDGAATRGALSARLRTLTSEQTRLRRDAEGEIVAAARVVGTTLARSRAHTAVAEQEFDVVIVDEAGAAILAEVVLAVARARTTAVLMGDFLQLPPVVNPAVERHTSGSVQRWMTPDSFTHCGIRTPEDARRDAGCVVLTDQFRFGPNLQRLANDVLYQVLADGRRRATGRATPDTTIVLVDVSEVGDLNVVHRSSAVAGWWAVGALLSRALAQHHAPESAGGVGVVTTHREQADATLCALRDTEVDTLVPVGTTHAFQGREFDTVVFDLVEDGNGWISKARADRGSFEYTGVRLFGVGITRTRHRLYLIADLRAVKGAYGATPFGFLNRLDRAAVSVCNAGALLGLAERSGRQPLSTVEAELAEVLREHIQVTEINDDLEFDDALERHLRGVRRSLWMWSPWVGRKSRRFLPLIADAVSRNVDTRIYIRTERDKILRNESNQRWVQELKDTGARIIRAEMEHKKVVVLDEQTVLLGSHNPLSQHGSRDVMITTQGAAFADRLLTDLGARDFNRPPSCAKCGLETELWRSTDRRRGRPYLWRCYPCDVRRPR